MAGTTGTAVAITAAVGGATVVDTGTAVVDSGRAGVDSGMEVVGMEAVGTAVAADSTQRLDQPCQVASQTPDSPMIWQQSNVRRNTSGEHAWCQARRRTVSSGKASLMISPARSNFPGLFADLIANFNTTARTQAQINSLPLAWLAPHSPMRGAPAFL
jgi:hypothetical protein